MLFTGADEATATALADNLFVPATLTAADIAGPVATFQNQAAQVTLPYDTPFDIPAVECMLVCLYQGYPNAAIR